MEIRHLKAFVTLAGTLHFAPPGYHLFVERERVFSLSCEPPVLYSRPSIDLLMETAADAYGPRLAGLLLTGAADTITRFTDNILTEDGDVAGVLRQLEAAGMRQALEAHPAHHTTA